MPSSRASSLQSGSLHPVIGTNERVVYKTRTKYVEVPAPVKKIKPSLPKPKTGRQKLEEYLSQSTVIPRRNSHKTIDAVRPNVGLQLVYRKQILEEIERMHRSVMYWLSAAYRANTPKLAEMAGDEMPVTGLKRTLRNLSRQWTKEFDKVAQERAPRFVKQVERLTQDQLKAKLDKIGFTVDFRMTPTLRDVLNASIHENVSLIKSIPQQYLTEVEGLVMRSVQQGRDLKFLTDELEKRFEITRNRAALIALDQNNKATAAITRARHLELGVTEAIWLHSTAGKHPRPAHVAMNGKKYDVRKGMWDDHEKRYVFPGELIHCRCNSRAIIPGLK